MPESPYGGKPGSGLQFPDYYKPTPSVRTRNNYFPGQRAAWAGRDAGLVRGELPVPAAPRSSGDMHHGRARQR
jgi:ribonuclease Z